MKIGIIKERKTPPDRRVVFTPEKLEEIKGKYPELDFVVEPSDIRIFEDEAYQKKGIPLSENLSDCDVLLGVKEVPVDYLIPNKDYFFFSHTIKKQEYNRELLQEILKRNINLFDHETLTDKNGKRLVGFGRYAGIVGAYNGFRLLGKRNKTFDLPRVESLPDYNAVLEALDRNMELPNLKITLTGRGKVAKGAKEIIEHLNIKQVDKEDFLTKNFDKPVFCQIHVLDYNRKKGGGAATTSKEFYEHPEQFESDFMRFARATDFLVTGHFHNEGAPYLFTREDAKKDHFKIEVVADISCDIDGPVASTIRPSTVAEPFYGYDPESESEADFNDKNSIAVMAVDNLPCELPKDASQGFGEMFADRILPSLAKNDPDGILKRAQITNKGALTNRFTYLQDFVAGKE